MAPRAVFSVNINDCFAYQSVNLGFVGEKGFPVALLVLDERLNVHVESVAALGVGALRRQLASFEQQGQKGEEGVSVNRNRNYDCDECVYDG